jgi:twitching motility protein PilT
MELFYKILKTAVDGHASDVHIKIGTPVIFRINRELIAIECPHPTESWMNNVIATITPAHIKKKVEEEREADFSYYIPNVGRFRTNLFQQRGQWCLAMREDERPKLRGARLAPANQKNRGITPRHCACGWFNRQR